MFSIDPAGPFAGPFAAGLALVLLMPPVIAVTRRFSVVGLCVSVLGSAVLTSTAATLAVVFGTPTVPWYWTVIGTSYMLAVASVIRRGWGVEFDTSGWDVGAGAALGLIPALVSLYAYPIHWDARSIWFFHASWFADAGSPYVRQFQDGVYGSIEDYPPLSASAGGFAWQFGEAGNDWIPQVATGLLTIAAALLLAIILWRPVKQRWLRVTGGLLTSLVALGVIGDNGLNGYVDGLLAVLLASLVVAAVTSERDPVVIATVALCIGLVKNEGLFILALVVVPVYLWRKVSIAPLLPGVAAGVTWAIAARLSEATPQGWQLENALPLSDDFVGRVGTILGAMWSQPAFHLGLIAWLAVLIALGVRGSKDAAWSRVAPFGAVAIGIIGFEVVTYLATIQALQVHLDTSVDRLMMHPALLWFIGAIGGAVAVLDESTTENRDVGSSVSTAPPSRGGPGEP